MAVKTQGLSGQELQLIPLDQIAKFLSLEGITSRVAMNDKENQKHQLTIGVRDTPLFLRKVFPYLTVKRRRSEDLLRLAKLFPSLNQHKLASSTIRRACVSEKQREAGRKWIREAKRINGRIVARNTVWPVVD